MSDQQQQPQNPLLGSQSKPFGGFGRLPTSPSIFGPSIANSPVGSSGFGPGQNQPQGQSPALQGFSGFSASNPLTSGTSATQTPGAFFVAPTPQGSADPLKLATTSLFPSNTGSQSLPGSSPLGGFPKPGGLFSTQLSGQQGVQQDATKPTSLAPSTTPDGSSGRTDLVGNPLEKLNSSSIRTPLESNTPANSMKANPLSTFSNEAKKQDITSDSFTTTVPTPPFVSLGGFGVPKDTAKDGHTDDKATGAGTTEKTNISDGKPEAKATGSAFPVFGAGEKVSTTKPNGTADTAAKSTAAIPGSFTAAQTTCLPPKVSVAAPSTLRGKSVEDIVNRWSTELETHTREFSKFASEVAVWDRTLIENGSYIAALYATVISAESTQASLDQTLDHVEQQQRQLMATLDQYEKTAHEILHGSGGIMTSTEGLGIADSERDKSYALAANLYTQLDDLSRSLTQMVETVNSLNLSPGLSTEPVSQGDTLQEDPISTISGILNAHLSSLQWIDNSLKDMEVKVKDAERKINDTGARRSSHGETGRGRAFGLGGFSRR